MQTEHKEPNSSLLLLEPLVEDNISRESACETNSILDCLGDLLFIIDKNRIITKVNKSACNTFKKKTEELIGRHCYEIVHGTKEPWCNCPATKTFETKQVTTEIINDPNLGVSLLVTTSAILDEHGEVAKVIHLAKDITEQEKAEERNLLLASIVDHSDDAIISKNLDGIITSWNIAAEKIYGYSAAEIIGKSIEILAPHDEKDEIALILKRICSGEQIEKYETKRRRKDGVEIDVSLTVSPIRNKGGMIVGASTIARDITENKKAEEKIKFHADLLNQVGQAALMVDNNRIIRFWNKAAEKLYGYSEEQALGHNITELLGDTSPEEAKEVSERLTAGESWSTEVLAKNKDGSVVPVILNRTPFYKENGEFGGSASISTDISLQKNTEADLTFSLKSLSNSLDRIQELNEKLRVVGSLTRHDVRNKLSAVTGYAHILKKKHNDLPDIVDGLSKMQQAVQETVKIFDFARMYEQIGVEELTYVNVEEKLEEAVALFSGPLPTIKNECHGLTVLGDSFLRQLFYNFIDNTRKYGEKTTAIRVHYEKAEQDSLKLIYEDDGVGVPLENKPRLFSEGFSTGGSTGFGLFLIKKMIEVYGWKIEENGTPNEGTKFTISIPNSAFSISVKKL